MDEIKRERNRHNRGSPFELAIDLFDSPTLEPVAFAPIAEAFAGSSVFVTLARGRGMLLLRRCRADIDSKKLWTELATQLIPTEAETEAQAAEDGNAWTEADVARAVRVHPAPTPAQVRALRARLGLTQMQFARQFGFSIDAVQQYEQGRRTPSGPASTLLRVIDADPEAVIRALERTSARPA